VKHCAQCGLELAESVRFCPSCGEPVGAPGDLPTEAPATGTASRAKKPSSPTPTPPRVSSSSDFSTGRFAPGEMLAGRYRILGRLGRGGMGEVYRADDLTLGQPVALKFLPTASVQDSGFIERFRSEVRNARGVSHPNVCRVYDIGEVNGEQFISMEYVDGEDLATLLRRIGRLPPAKALEIARQLCAGLAAAHDKGVLHRDLKPANIMIDGQGRARITDFGLAVTGEEAATDGRIAGTPAYMAPEQLAGRGATAKSDIYSLGLVFYEVFTGKRAFEGATLAELRRQHSEVQPKALSSHITDIDPATERVILRCLEKDPKLRPATALAVAAALPGGDPLAAALAAGETPSPDLVAAAGETEGFKPRTAIACLAVVVIAIIAACALTGKVQLSGIAPVQNPPEALAVKAHGLIRRFGYTAPPADSAFAFVYDYDHLQYIEQHDKSPNRWEQLKSQRPGPIEFWYRSSPRYLEPGTFFSGEWRGPLNGLVKPDDPPRDISGMTYVVLDPSGEGRLEYFEAVPPQKEEAQGTAPAPDWSVLFKAAGLDLAKFKPADPEWASPVGCDVRAAWTGEAPDGPGTPVRVEAAAYRGKPVYFQLIWPWTQASRMQTGHETTTSAVAYIIPVVLLWVILIGAVLLARRNQRQGRGDRRGAFRLAVFVLVILLLGWVMTAHHVPTSHEFGLFVMGLSYWLFFAALAWLLYIALEPYVRRRWPVSIISWSRMLAGQLRDPLVGRDVLIGVTFGVLVHLWFVLQQFAEGWFGKLAPIPWTNALDPLLGARGELGQLLNIIPPDIAYPLAAFFLFFLLRLFLRRERLAATAFVLIFVLVDALPGQHLAVDAVFVAILYAGWIVVLTRFGLLPLVVHMISADVLTQSLLTSNLSAWYAVPTFMGVAFVLALAIYGFKTSLGGQAIFSGAALDE
jgi:Protein kinase domain